MQTKKLLFAFLNEINKENVDIKHEDFGDHIGEEEFYNVIILAHQENYITGLYYADDLPHYERANLTMKGIEFLEENNTWAKAYRGLKELRDWLKP